VCPSPAPREREGPAPQAWEGEGISAATTLTRLAPLATLSRIAGEGLMPDPLLPPVMVLEADDVVFAEIAAGLHLDDV
jgi:hypothetical protein